jgi:hypothetical protein
MTRRAFEGDEPPRTTAPARNPATTRDRGESGRGADDAPEHECPEPAAPLLAVHLLILRWAT